MFNSLTDDQIRDILNQIQLTNSQVAIGLGGIQVLKVLEILLSEILYLRKKFNVFETSFINHISNAKEETQMAEQG